MYNKIYDPMSKKTYSLNSKKGMNIIKNYINILNGGASAYDENGNDEYERDMGKALSRKITDKKSAMKEINAVIDVLKDWTDDIPEGMDTGLGLRLLAHFIIDVKNLKLEFPTKSTLRLIKKAIASMPPVMKSTFIKSNSSAFTGNVCTNPTHLKTQYLWHSFPNVKKKAR